MPIHVCDTCLHIISNTHTLVFIAIGFILFMAITIYVVILSIILNADINYTYSSSLERISYLIRCPLDLIIKLIFCPLNQ